MQRQKWPRYGLQASAYAAQLRDERPGVPVTAGTGLVYPTWCRELARAIGEAEVEDLVPIALRRGRSAAGLSQRAAAQAWGVAHARLARAEVRPAELKLGTVLDLLRAAGHDLQVVDADGSPLGDLRAGEVLARTGNGRRLPAGREAVRLTHEPRWMAERGESFVAEGPQWTTERRAGQYP